MDHQDFREIIIRGKPKQISDKKIVSRGNNAGVLFLVSSPTPRVATRGTSVTAFLADQVRLTALGALAKYGR